MRRSSEPHRFLVDAGSLEGTRVTLVGGQARQIATVLRLAPGARVVLLHEGDEVEARLDEVDPRAVRATVLARRPSAAEPALRLTLALPLLRGDRAEEVVEAVVQLGVTRVVPFTSERSVARDLSAARRERWQRIARESAETARRGRAPEIAPAVAWGRLFDALDPPVVVAWEGERDRALTQTVPPGTAVLSLVVGPEGGLTEDEIGHARERGARTVSLGARNLRSETAAIAAVAQVLVLAEGS